jgi:hypothetical protein
MWMWRHQQSTSILVYIGSLPAAGGRGMLQALFLIHDVSECKFGFQSTDKDAEDLFLQGSVLVVDGVVDRISVIT